jgi:hypothetical protein
MREKLALMAGEKRLMRAFAWARQAQRPLSTSQSTPASRTLTPVHRRRRFRPA